MRISASAPNPSVANFIDFIAFFEYALKPL